MPTTEPCKTCGGFGTMPHRATTGKRMRRLRDAKGVSRNAIAEAMKLSPTFISLLESGNQRWSNARVAAFIKALETLTKPANKPTK